jgi:hypothetical protein
MKDPKELAKNLIRVYILRGETEEEMMRGKLGSYGGGTSISIGGYAFDRSGQEWKIKYRAKRNEVIVDEIDDKPCLYVFDIYKLAKEIRDEAKGIKQISLF